MDPVQLYDYGTVPYSTGTGTSTVPSDRHTSVCEVAPPGQRRSLADGASSASKGTLPRQREDAGTYSLLYARRRFRKVKMGGIFCCLTG